MKQSAVANAGRNMSAYTSSGSMAKSLQSLTGGGAASAAADSVPQEMIDNPNAAVSWSQTGAEVEVKIKFPVPVLSKNLKVRLIRFLYNFSFKLQAK